MCNKEDSRENELLNYPGVNARNLRVEQKQKKLQISLQTNSTLAIGVYIKLS